MRKAGISCELDLLTRRYDDATGAFYEYNVNDRWKQPVKRDVDFVQTSTTRPYTESLQDC